MANEISIVVRTTDAASRGFGAIGQAATGMNSAIEAAGSALDSIDAIQQSGTQKAERLARAQLDVQQAMVDNEQATTDLKQAQNDLTQSQNDGAQAGIDLEQAQIDQKQANLDATVAQKEYNKAVKEHGKNSEEARQASIDLVQAKSDLHQADLDAKQAQTDATQAQIDGKQAVTDMKQATIDAKSSQLDLNAAQREVDPTFIQQASQKFQELAPAIGLATLAASSMSNMMNLTRIRTIAATAATKAMAVAQRVLNVVMRMNPIGLVITAITLLVAGLILAYKKSDTFRAVVQAAFKAVKVAVQIMWQAIKSAFGSLAGALSGAGQKFRRFYEVARSALSSLVSFARSIPGRISGAFGSLYGIITNPVRNAVNAVRSWLGGLVSFARSIPGKIGGAIKGIVPGFAHGGVVGQAASGATSSGLTMTSEHGPELLNLPPGTRVRSNPDTRRMVAGSSGGDTTVTIILKGTDVLEGLRQVIRVKGGNVQTVMGKG
jgi:phage-related protein